LLPYGESGDSPEALIMSIWQHRICRLGLMSGLLWSAVMGAYLVPLLPSAVAEVPAPPTMEQLLKTLPDGPYQFCTEPDPRDWRDGAGACFNFVKQELTLAGYYGYPHSGDFVCLRGQVAGNELDGQGLVVLWAGQSWFEIPTEEIVWDREGRLYLSEGSMVAGSTQVSQIVFGQARLNLQGLYQYPESRMTPPTQLCDWPPNA
jgi:hypothetical protein